MKLATGEEYYWGADDKSFSRKDCGWLVKERSDLWESFVILPENVSTVSTNRSESKAPFRYVTGRKKKMTELIPG